MSFKNNFIEAVEKHRGQTGDEYTELQYSDKFYIHVASYMDKEESIEIYVIVPHEEVELDLQKNQQAQLPLEIDGAEELYQEIESLLSYCTTKDLNPVFYLQDVVTDGVWEHDASMYCSEEIKL